MKNILLLALCTLGVTAYGQVTYNGNGNTGFGGPVGNSSMSWNDDGTTITVNFTKGAGDFNDAMVIYLATGATGRTSISSQVNDRQDLLRSAISFMEAATGHSLNLPSGFQATHAIGINTGFGGLWAIPASGAIGNNGLTFVSSVSSTLSASNQAGFTFSFTWAQLGLSAGDPINFVATYLNPFGGDGNLGFAANEGYGGGLPGGNIGQASATFTTYLQYPSGQIGGTASTTAAGNWTDLASWTNGNVPFSTDRILVNHNLAVNTMDAAASSVDISAGNTLTINADNRLSVTGGVEGAGNFNVNGIFRINAGGFTTIQPTYGAGTSQLTYNSGGGYNTGVEWPATSSPASIRIINSAVTLTGSRNVTGLLNIENGGSLDVDGHTLSLKATSESDYSQLLNNGTLTGNVTFERAITGSNQGWRFISPAVTGTLANLGSSVQLTGAANVIRLNTANPNAWVAQGGASTDAFTAGRAYAVYFGNTGANANNVAGTLSLTGSIVNTDVTVTGLSDGNGGNDFGWTLVGNPYPCGIDWTDAGHTKTNLADAYYIWDPNAGGGSGHYASYVGTTSTPGGALDNIIPPMQGFLVKATAASPALTFAAAARSSDATKAQMRTASSVLNRMYVRITNQQSQFWDETALVSQMGATTAYEDQLDAFKLKSFHADAVNLSSLSSDQRKLSINSMGLWDHQTSIPLHLESSQAVAMRLTVNLDEVDAALPVFLEDKFTNQFHDLRSADYQFVHQAGQNDRFVIHFNNTLSTSVKANDVNQALVYTFEGHLYVKNLTGEANVQILDMQGRVVYKLEDAEIEQPLLLPAFAKGTYLVRIQAAQGVKTTKVIF
ncbi:MAG: T9SS type A sorting domain-containing protein [Bacteroidia bacterium]